MPPEQHQHGAYQQPQHGAYQQPAQQYAPQPDSYQQDPYHQPQSYAQPLPPEAGPAGNMRQGGDADATQYIAPVPGGALPGGMPPEHQAESTQYLGHHAAPAQQSDADATQYIPPVPGGAPYGIRPGAPGDRQPPAEFDSLFRSDEPAGATQQMPRVAGHQQPPHQGGYQQPPQGAQPYRSGLQELT
ncbi:hypothetical protein DLE01_12840, partial [Streptomyces sp. FT05W]